MVHPFERILSDEDCLKGDDQRSGRRYFLKLAAGGAVVAVAGRAFGQRSPPRWPLAKRAVEQSDRRSGQPAPSGKRAVGRE